MEDSFLPAPACILRPLIGDFNRVIILRKAAAEEEEDDDAYVDEEEEEEESGSDGEPEGPSHRNKLLLTAAEHLGASILQGYFFTIEAGDDPAAAGDPEIGRYYLVHECIACELCDALACTCSFSAVNSRAQGCNC